MVETLITNYSFGGILIFVIKRAPIRHQCLKFQVFEHLSLAGGNLSVGSNINFQFSYYVEIISSAELLVCTVIQT